MKKCLLIVSFYFLTFAMTLAQNSSISVFDSSDKKTLPGARIEVLYPKAFKKITILADDRGQAIIQGDSDEKVTVFVSFVGYKTIEETIAIGTNKEYYLKTDNIQLNSIVITGQYCESNSQRAVQKITIIDEKKISRMAAINLKDVLSNELNIRLSQDNILGSGMSLQGMGGENVKILIDGVPVIGRLNGNLDLSQINLNDIERIEIVQGPMSVNYGTNALAGVINLITKTNKSKNMVARVNAFNESIGQYNLDARFAVAKKKHAISFSGGRNYFDGWTELDRTFGEKPRIADSTRFKSWKPKTQYFGKMNYSYNLKEGDVKYAVSYFDEKISNRGLPRVPYGETAFDDYYTTIRMDNSLNYNKKINNKKQIQATIAYNDYKRIKNTFFKNLTNLEEMLSKNSDDQDTTKFNQWVLRSSYSTSKDSAKFNYELGIDINREEAFGKRIAGKSQQMGNYAAYTSFEYKPYKNTIVRPGIRYAHNTIYNSPLTPSVNFKQIVGKYSIRASYAKGFRAPSLKELFFDFNDVNHNIIGNIELIAERSENFNLSADYSKQIKSHLLKMEARLFYNTIENLITLAQSSGASFSYINIGNYQTHGFQLNSKISDKDLTFDIGGTYIGRYNYLSEINTVEKFSYTTEIKSNINYEFYKHQAFISVFYKYTGILPGFGLTPNDQVIQTYIDSYHTADLSIGKKFWGKRLQIVIGSKNLFNVKNINSLVQGSAHNDNSGSSPVAMGRTYFLKISLNFQHGKNN